MFINEQYVGDEFHNVFDMFVSIHGFIVLDGQLNEEAGRDIIFSLCAS